MNGSRDELSLLRFAIALGFTVSIGMLFLGLIATYCGWAVPMVEAIGSVYIGYTTTLVGSLVGGAWGFVDGFVCGALIAIVYNLLGKWMR